VSTTVSVLDAVEPETGPAPASVDLTMADDGETVRVEMGGLVVVRLPDDADLWSVSDATWAGQAGTFVELCGRRDTCAREGCTRSSDLLVFRAIGTTKSRLSLVSMNGRFDVQVATAEPAADASPGWAEVEVTQADDGATLDLTLGDTLTIRLPSQVGLGMGWFLANEEAIPMTSCGAGAWGPDWPAPEDAVYLEVFEFVPVATGTTDLLLEYRDTAAPDAPPQDTLTLTVQVDR
jgi:predicted secreted protein